MPLIYKEVADALRKRYSGHSKREASRLKLTWLKRKRKKRISREKVRAQRKIDRRIAYTSLRHNRKASA